MLLPMRHHIETHRIRPRLLQTQSLSSLIMKMNEMTEYQPNTTHERFIIQK